jgi:RNA polymerase sigma-70 factor (ECF subfamily)
MDLITSSHGLVQRVQQGDRDAFARLFEKHSRPLAVIIYYQMGSNARRMDEVDDILQETLLRAFRDIDQFEYRSSGSFLRWLARIAGHVIADLARSQNRQKRAGEHVRFRSDTNPGGPEPVDSATPSRIFAENQSLAGFIGKLDLLPEDYRRVILLAKVEGFTTGEIAQQLGKSNEAVALLLHRAIKRLRFLMQGQE